MSIAHMWTVAILESHLWPCLARLVEGYFVLWKMNDESIAEAGHGELCLRIEDVNVGLYGACKGGHMLIAKMMIDLGATNWDSGLGGACKGGHLHMVIEMINRGATCWNYGLGSACRGGHLHMATEMIDRGATRWNYGLGCACQYGHFHMAKLMIANGATYCKCGRPIAEHLAT